LAFWHALAAHAFVSHCDLTNTSVGLISFSDQVRVDTKACQNAKRIARAINGLDIGRTGYGNATDPFREIHRCLNKVSGLRYAVVLADGVWANQGLAIRRAHKCHRSDIEIIAIGFGGADRHFLRQVSSSDEHSFFTDVSALIETFSSIAQELTESVGQSGGGLLLRLA